METGTVSWGSEISLSALMEGLVPPEILTGARAVRPALCRRRDAHLRSSQSNLPLPETLPFLLLKVS